MSEAYRTQPPVLHCSRCTKEVDASELTMATSGDWICMPCDAQAKATAVSDLATEIQLRREIASPLLWIGLGIGAFAMALLSLYWLKEWLFDVIVH